MALSPVSAACLMRRALARLTWVSYEPHAGSLSAETLVDGISQGGIAITIGTGLATYGVSEYGLASYGGAGRRKAYTPLPLEAEGGSVQQNFVYAGQEDFALFTYAIGFVPEPNPLQVSL